MEGSDEVDGRGGSPTGPDGKGWVDVLPGASKENRICVSMRRCVGGLAPAMRYVWPAGFSVTTGLPLWKSMHCLRSSAES